MRVREFVARIRFSVTFVPLSSVFNAVPICFLWNWLLPGLFGVPEINFGQAWGICCLVGVLRRGLFYLTIGEGKR